MYSEYAKVIQTAKLAEFCTRYEDMALFMEEAVKIGKDGENTLCDEGRNLFSVAFKNVLGARRASWKSCRSEDPAQTEDAEKIMKDYKAKIEKELEEWSEKGLNYLKKLKLKSQNNQTDTREDEIIYLKMEGDYNRYRAEYLKGDALNKVVNAAAASYSSAADLAISNLPETHPTRLGLMLNYSVFKYEVQQDPKKACEIAKKAFDTAIQKLDTLNDASYKDSTLIMQLLRDNLTLWTTDNPT